MSLWPFFELAGRSPSRQRAFRQLVAVQSVVLGAALGWCAIYRPARAGEVLSLALLVLGIVEGALLIGWRLAQWPKSKAMELLFVTSLSPRNSMVGEQLVGLVLLGFLVLSSLPLLVVAVGLGWIEPAIAMVSPAYAYTFGAMTGFGLVSWAYEPQAVRKWGERAAIVLLLTYLVVGGLAGERTFALLSGLPHGLGYAVRDAFLAMHRNNPFALLHRLAWGHESGLLSPLLKVEAAGLGLTAIFLARSAWRLKPHYIEYQYQPKKGAEKRKGEPAIGDAPLAWWAVRRVSQYSGRINLYLAGGASVMYALFVLLEDRWPSFLGSHMFLVFERMGGVAGIGAGLVVLAAVPAAYQFGLWESSAAERCKRLEIFLMTPLAPDDYVEASWRASWRRGRGYLYCAAVLWTAGWLGGRISAPQLLLAIAGAASLLLFFFAVGHHALAESSRGTSMGFGLSVVLPLGVWGLAHTPAEGLATVIPPGPVYFAIADPHRGWIVGAASVALAAAAAALLHRTMRGFDEALRHWYDANVGRAA